MWVSGIQRNEEGGGRRRERKKKKKEEKSLLKELDKQKQQEWEIKIVKNEEGTS